MEPFDFPKNDENRTSRRRISSILKAPRKSVKLSEPERVEPQVEVVKPIEKRNSRRVSFAPANDVVLFQKDEKNGSPGRGPLQDLSAANNLDKRVSIDGIGDGIQRIQPITGMETLLSAPLHSSQQRKDAFFLNRNTEDHYGEKTMMFTADDAAMDVTHSHTIIIASDVDSHDVLPDCDILSTHGNMNFTWSANLEKSQQCNVPKTISSSMCNLDPEFENFLTSISKPSGSRGNPVLQSAPISLQDTVGTKDFLAHLKMQSAGFNKENQAPAFMSAKVEKQPHKTKEIGESSHTSVILSEDAESMDMTEARFGHIVKKVDTDEPLNCLFPTPELYQLSDNLKPTEIKLGLESAKASECLFPNPNGTKSVEVAHSKRNEFGLPSFLNKVSGSNLNSTWGLAKAENFPLSHSKITHRVSSLDEDTRHKGSSSESDNINIRGCQTVPNEVKSLSVVTDLTQQQQERSRFSNTSRETRNAFDTDLDDMELTGCQTRVTEEKQPGLMSSMSINARQSAGDKVDRTLIQGRNAWNGNKEINDLEITQSQTVTIDSGSLGQDYHFQNSKRQILAFTTENTKQSNALEDDMELTSCQTGVLEAKDFTEPVAWVDLLGSNKKLPLNNDKHMDQMPSRGEAIESRMELTESQKVYIDVQSLPRTKPLQRQSSLSFVAACPKAASEDGCGIHITKASTVSIDYNTKSVASNIPSNSLGRTPHQSDSQYGNYESDDMEMTKSQTVVIDTKSLHPVNSLQIKKRKSLAFTPSFTRVFNTPEDDCAMETTKALTGSIDHISQPVRLPNRSFNSSSKTDIKMGADADDMEFTTCQNRVIAAKTLGVVKPGLNVLVGGQESPFDSNKKLLLEGEKDMDGMSSQREGSQNNHCESDDMELTKSQTVVIDTKSLHPVNSFQMKKHKSLASTPSFTRVFNTPQDDCAMEMTKALTGSIDIAQPVRLPDKSFNSSFSKTDIKMGDDADDMEFTICQNRVITEKALGVVKPGLNVLLGGQENPFDLNKKLLSEGEKGMDGMSSQREGSQNNRCEFDDMELTKSQTVVIDTKSLHPVNSLQMKKRKSLAFTPSFTRVFNTLQDDCAMEMTKALTGSNDHISRPVRLPDKSFNGSSKTDIKMGADDMEFTTCQNRVITEKALGVVKPGLNVSVGGQENPFDSNKKLLSEGEKDMDGMSSQREGSQNNNCESDHMELTKSQTVVIDTKSLCPVNSFQMKHKSLASTSSFTRVFNTPQDDCAMEMTKALTGSIDIAQPVRLPDKSFNSSFPKTDIKMGDDADDMEFTTCQNRVIAAKALGVVKPGLNVLVGGQENPFDSNKRLLSEDEKDMDRMLSQREGSLNNHFESDDMDITKCQTVLIEAKSLQAINPVQNMRRKSLAFMTACPKAGNASEGGCGMEMTKASKSSSSIMPSKPLDSLSSKTTESKADTDMEITRCQTKVIEAKHSVFMQPPLNIGSGGSDVIPNSITNLCSTVSDALDNTKGLMSDFGANAHQNGTSFQGSMAAAVVSTNDTVDMTGSNVITMGPKYTIMANDALIITGNLDTKPSQEIGQLDDQSKALIRHTYITGQECELDMEMTRDKTIPIESNQQAPSFCRSLLSQVDEMAIIDDHAMTCDQLKATENAMNSSSLSDKCPSATESHTVCPGSPEVKNNDSELEQENGHQSRGLDISPSSTNTAVSSVDDASSQTTQTRRRSLANLQSKLRRISQLMIEPPKELPVDSVTLPLTQLQSASEKNICQTQPLPAKQQDPEADHTEQEHFTQEEQTFITAPLNLKSKHLMSRLSMGRFMPKLPQRAKPVKSNKLDSSPVKSAGELEEKTNPITVALQMSSYMMDNINDEVFPNMSHDEDLSDTLDTKAHQGTSEESPLQGPNMEDALEEVKSEESLPGAQVSQAKKRPLPADHRDTMEDGKRRPALNDNLEPHEQQQLEVDCDGLSTAQTAIVSATEASNSSNTTNLRCEATFDSTLKQSMFGSQLEEFKDYTNDFHKKLHDDSITVLEFFKLFNCDFVIHNPRQSVLPGKLASDLKHTPEDLLRNRHINHPKQRVYELDHQNLAEKVKRLKARMKDGEIPLQSVNRPLWKEMTALSEKEIHSLGAKWKERSNFFRKRSKAQSHEMKEALYSNIFQANLEEQQKLRGRIEEADGMLRCLDDCIQELEAELATVEGMGLGDSKLTLNSSHLGLEKVTAELADNEGQRCELETQKQLSVEKLNRIRTETQHLNSRVTTLHWVNEWRLGEKRTNCTVYTFLFESFHLEVVFDGPEGEEAEETGRNIIDIHFKHEIDEQKSQCHARLVHRLLSEHTEAEIAWVEKYPTSRYVPKLLHDVGLVVSRCRLLGEEVHMLKLWGAQRLDLLHVSCVDTQIRVVFSSLKAMTKFECSVGVTAAYPFKHLGLQDFKNYVGNTSVGQVKEVVSSVSPGRKYLTRIIKELHTALLS